MTIKTHFLIYVCVYVCMAKLYFYSTFTLKKLHKDNWMYYGTEKLCAKCHENNTKLSFIHLFVHLFLGGDFFGSNVIGHRLFH